MPQTKLQEIVFSLLMAFAMVYGMEVYNTTLLNGAFSASILLSVFPDLLRLMLTVIVLEKALGGVLARKLAFKIVTPGVDHPTVVTLAISACTVLIMCPLMSLAAVVLFKSPTVATWPSLWCQTIILNLPMAFCWQILCAGPLVRFIFRRIFIHRRTCKSC